MTARLERIKQVLAQRPSDALTIPVQSARVRNGKIPVTPDGEQPLLRQIKEWQAGDHVQAEIQQPSEDQDGDGKDAGRFRQLAIVTGRQKRHDREEREPCGVHEAEVEADEFECLHQVSLRLWQKPSHAAHFDSSS